MGLSIASTGRGAALPPLEKRGPEDLVIALAGNPNVGKSTLFNQLTGLRQHTGNWPGKTIVTAQGWCRLPGPGRLLVDLPGCYSLLAHSPEEEAARDFLCFGGADCALVVCDATCLERNLILALQALEITPHLAVCVNLMDEARRKGIQVDLEKLSRLLGVPVTGARARSGQGLEEALRAADQAIASPGAGAAPVAYAPWLEDAVGRLLPCAARLCRGRLAPRWLCLRLLEGLDPGLAASLADHLGCDPREDPETARILGELRREWDGLGRCAEAVGDEIAGALVARAQALALAVTRRGDQGYSSRDRKLDRLLTSRWTGFPVMLLLLLGVFWITLAGANYPSQALSAGLFWVGDRLEDLFVLAGAPPLLISLLLDGVYRTLAWVVAVMLPPMAIFFPLFTLLEDLGYLPRVAFNLDRCFQGCGACGKQALTTCMGFGCNAAGVVGCRIIDSPRERLVAMLTNSFVPCNGRLPLLVTLISLFFAGTSGGLGSSALAALMLVGVILLGLGMSLAVSRFLSRTLLKGAPSSFTLELPPYRRPQVGRVIVRSLWDRALFVLGRAAAVAAPAGLVLWGMANLSVGGASLLDHCAAFLDPFARLFGLDGVILLAFVLALPANEIVLPIILMAYLSQGSLVELGDLSALHALLVDRGWTWVTALCVMVFSLMHWPCSTTCMTIRKEAGGWRWAAWAAALPTACGLGLCFLIAGAARLFSLL